MSSKLEGAIQALQAQIEAVSPDHATVDFLNDLSGDGAVQWCDPWGEPWAFPCVALKIADVRSTPRTGIGKWRRDVRVDVVAYTPPTEDSGLARALASIRLMHDLVRAVELDLSLDGNVLHTTVASTTWDFADPGSGVMLAGASLSIEFFFHSDSGV